MYGQAKAKAIAFHVHVGSTQFPALIVNLRSIFYLIRLIKGLDIVSHHLHNIDILISMAAPEHFYEL